MSIMFMDMNWGFEGCILVVEIPVGFDVNPVKF